MNVGRTVRRWVPVLILIAGVAFAQTAVTDFQGPELEQFLSQGKITRGKQLEGVTRSFKVTLEMDGKTQFGVWKTIDEQKTVAQLDRGPEIGFQDSWRTDVAAYEVDRIIGLGMVPVTVERRFDGQTGSVQLWVESKMTEFERIQKKIRAPDTELWNRLIFKTRLFDNLIYNTDRHLNNLLITETFQIRLIDHSRSFRWFDELQKPKDLTRFSKGLLTGLGKLNEPILKERVGKYLTPDQIRGLLKRRDLILELARKQVAEKGEAAVVYYP